MDLLEAVITNKSNKFHQKSLKNEKELKQYCIEIFEAHGELLKNIPISFEFLDDYPVQKKELQRRLKKVDDSLEALNYSALEQELKELRDYCRDVINQLSFGKDSLYENIDMNKARKIYSDEIKDYLWLVPDDADIDSFDNEGFPVFTFSEIKELRKAKSPKVKLMYQTKVIFPGAKVNKVTPKTKP